METNEKEYIYGHLRQFVRAAEPLESLMRMPESRATEPDTRHRVRGVAVPYPCSDDTEPYRERDGHIEFSHDLIRSAFYILSGRQEYETCVRDKWGRFPYEESYQSKTGTIGIPLANYYFEWIAEGVERECALRGVRCERTNPLGGVPVLHMTHDVDLLRYYTTRKALFRTAQVVGLRRCDTDRLRLTKAAVGSLMQAVGLRRHENPYWSFDKITGNENYMGYHSTWFFLPDDGGPFAPDYALTDRDVMTKMEELARAGHDIGLHAPIRCQRADEYTTWMSAMRGAAAGALPYCRQHFLAVDAQRTLRAMEEAGIEVDSSLGFSAHEGFRNGYCFPFHPYDHERGRKMKILEIPLMAMDTTMLTHRGLSYDEIYISMGEMLDEVRHFGGVLSVLWHNTTFDEVYHPGIFRFYEGLHTMLAQYQMQGLTTREIAERCQ